MRTIPPYLYKKSYNISHTDIEVCEIKSIAHFIELLNAVRVPENVDFMDFVLEEDYNSLRIKYYVYETDEEFLERTTREKAEYAEFLAKEKAREAEIKFLKQLDDESKIATLQQAAEKYGYKLVKE